MGWEPKYNKENPGASLDANKQVGLQVNAKKTKYMLMSHHQTGGQKFYIKVSFENVAKFKYLGMTMTNKDCIHIKAS
jgi:hypothetical protein